MEQNTESSLNLFELQFDNEASGYLGDTARWGKFLAIVGFIFCGLMFLVAIYLAAISSSYENSGIARAYGMSTGALAVLYFVLATVYFFPCLFLLRFSGRMIVALRNNDQMLLNRSLKNLRACFRYIGIMTIIMIGLFILIIVLAVINNMH